MNLINIQAIPSQPLNVTGSRTGYRSLSISWTAPASPGGTITNYIIELSRDNGSTWFRVPQPVLTNTTHTINGLNLTSGTWRARVRALNIDGSGPFSSPSSPISLTWTPNPPTGVLATQSGNSINISWSAPSDISGGSITGYRIYVASTPDNISLYTILVNNTNSSSTTYSMPISTLRYGVAHYFRVASINSNGASNLSSVSNVLVIVPKIAAPGNLVAVPGNASVLLSWTAPTGYTRVISDYIVEYSSNSGASWTVYNDGIYTNTHANVTGLINGVFYLFRVAGVNANGVGDYAQTSVAVAPNSTPQSPTNIQCVSGQNNVTVSWTPPQNTSLIPAPAITGYIVEYSTANTTARNWIRARPIESSQTMLLPGLTNDTSAIVQSLSSNTPYVFRVAARNSIGIGRYSAESAICQTRQTIGKPTNIVATSLREGTISVTWNAPTTTSGAGVMDYHVIYAEDTGSLILDNWRTFEDSVTTATSVVVTGLTLGKRYRFAVRARNNLGFSLFNDRPLNRSSDIAAIATFPSATRNLTGVLNRRTITLYWDPPLNDGGSPLDRYRIQLSTDNVNWNVVRRCGNTFCFTPNGVQDDPYTTYHSINGLLPGRSYWFRVGAINKAGHRGTFSNRVGPFTVPIVQNYNKSQNCHPPEWDSVYVNWGLLRCVTDTVNIT